MPSHFSPSGIECMTPDLAATGLALPIFKWPAEADLAGEGHIVAQRCAAGNAHLRHQDAMLAHHDVCARPITPIVDSSFLSA